MEEVRLPPNLWEWESLELSVGGNAQPICAWVLNGKHIFSAKIQGKLKGPKIYRFLVATKLDEDTQEIKEAYVGQSADFLQRIKDYRSGLRAHLKAIQELGKDDVLAVLNQTGQDLTNSETNRRIATTLLGRFGNNAAIEIQTLNACSISINGANPYCIEDISDPFVRSMIENIAILKTRNEGYSLWNQGTDETYKWFSRQMASTHKSNERIIVGNEREIYR